MTHPPDWRPLAGSPGFYVDAAGALHIDAPEAIKANGYRPTPANIAALEAAARDMAKQIGAAVEVHDARLLSLDNNMIAGEAGAGRW